MLQVSLKNGAEVQNAQDDARHKAGELRTVTLQRVRYKEMRLNLTTSVLTRCDCSEGNKLHECESKLHKAERQVEQLTAEVMQCKVKIQELEESG